jgi:hypothetical protein
LLLQVRKMPKAELRSDREGTLEPESIVAQVECDTAQLNSPSD